MLPDFTKLPTVMSYEEVEIIFNDIMHVAESCENVSPYLIQNALNEAFGTLEFNPRGKFGIDLSDRVVHWVQKNWQWTQGNTEFIDGLIFLHINFADAEVSKDFFNVKLETDNRGFVQTEIKGVLENDV